MGKIFCIMGKSATGKDTIYKSLLQNSDLKLNRIVSYTTRPIREGEEDGIEYHFTDVEIMHQLEEQGKIIECRAYDTIHGIWYYYMVKDSQIDLTNNNYLIIGTLESYEKVREYYGNDIVVPIYVYVEDDLRVTVTTVGFEYSPDTCLNTYRVAVGELDDTREVKLIRLLDIVFFLPFSDVE